MNQNLLQSKILIIDDEEAIAVLLERLFKKEGFENVKVAFSVKEGLQSFKTFMPDLVLLDIMLPDGDGYELLKVFESIRSVPCLFISAKDEEVDRLLGFAMGADDYITKPFSPKEVVYRVKARLRYIRPSVEEPLVENDQSRSGKIAFGDVVIDPDAMEVKRSNQLLTLTAKEYKILLFLVENPNRIISKERICQAVWGEEFIGFDNTISVHIRKIRLKIEENPSKPKWIQTVIGLGYKFVPKER